MREGTSSLLLNKTFLLQSSHVMPNRIKQQTTKTLHKHCATILK